MAGKAATLVIRILTDVSNAQKGLDDTSSKVGKFRSGMAKATGPALAVVGAIAGIATVAGRAASELQQADGAVESVFGKSADTVKSWGRDAAESVGLATTEYENLAAVVGSQLKATGTATDQLAPKTKDLIALGADLAATFGGSTADAVEAVGSLLRGERDPIEKYGVSIKQASIDAYEAAHGLGKLTGAAKTQADAQATLAILTEQTASAQGQFARESDTAAGAQARSQAEMANASATLGQVLLPYMAQFSTLLAQVAKWIGRNTKVLIPIVAVLGAVALAVLAVNAALAIMAAVTALIAAPWLAIALAVVAVVALLVLAYKKVTFFRNAVDAVVGFAVAAFGQVVDAVQAIVGVVTSTVSAIVGAVSGVVEGIVGIVQGAIDWIARNWRVLVVILAGPFGVAALLIIKNMDLIRAGFRLLTGAVLAVARFVKGVLVAAFGVLAAIARPYVDAVRVALNLLTGAARAVGRAVSGVIVGAFRALKSAATAVIDAVRGPLLGVFRTLNRIVAPILAAITSLIDGIVAAFEGVAGAVKSVIDLISKIKLPKWLDRLNPFTKGGKAAPAPSVAAAYGTPGLRAVPTSTTSSRAGGAGVTVQIFGAVDPQGTARAVQRLLHNADVRTGRRRLA